VTTPEVARGISHHGDEPWPRESDSSWLVGALFALPSSCSMTGGFSPTVQQKRGQHRVKFFEDLVMFCALAGRPINLPVIAACFMGVHTPSSVRPNMDCCRSCAGGELSWATVAQLGTFLAIIGGTVAWLACKTFAA